MWTLHRQEQQRGVQFKPQLGTAPLALSPEGEVPPHHAVVAVKESGAKPETTDPADLPLPEGK